MSETQAPDYLDGVAADVLRAAVERDLRLATAESCTGGLLSALLTDVEGLSHAFERGFVVYDEQAKVEMLGLDPARLKAEGAVSDWAARAMAEGALAHSRADLAIAITGFAGKGQKEGDEEGLVHMAVARRSRDTASTIEHLRASYGACGRAEVRAQAAEAALKLACAMLSD